jgi:hypothetical protein
MRIATSPEVLQNPKVRRWLDGVVPAWTMLDFASYAVLRQEPLPGNEAIRLVRDLTEADLAGSAVARTARVMLQQAVDAGGLRLTMTGNLSRAVVAEMIEVIEWPGLNKAEFFQFHKVINEPDFLPIHFVRVVLQAAKLLRAHRDKLVPTRLGKKLLAPEQHGVLQALLFHISFWHLNLGYFDRNPIDGWPQNDVGVVLWSLSIAINDWMHRNKLTRLCTVPTVSVVESTQDLGSYAMEARILRPLVWFGLLENKPELHDKFAIPHLYRKTSLFDRSIEFRVQIDSPPTRH